MADISFNSLLKRSIELASEINSRPGVEFTLDEQYETEGESNSSIVVEMGADDMDSDSENEDLQQDMHDIITTVMSEVDQMDEAATELFQSLMMLKELYSQAERSKQMLMAEELAKSEQEGALEEYYAL